jgi:ribonuclease G
MKYKTKISFVADDNISLNEFKATLAGSDLEITDVVLQGDSIEDILKAHELQAHEPEAGNELSSKVDFYSKGDQNGKPGRQSRPKRPARQSH